MKRKILFAAALIAAAAVAFSSCEKDTDHDDDRIYIEEGEGLADPVTASDEKVELPAAIVGRMPDYLQTALNVLGSVDLLPLTGVTFPFVSNGGSAMMASWGLLAFLKASDTREKSSFAIRSPAGKEVPVP